MTPAIAHGGAVTDIVIQPLTVTNQADLNRCDNSFTVQAELSLAATDGRINYTVRPVVPHIKHYAPEVYDAQPYTLAPAHTDRCSAGVEKPDRAAWLAYVDGALAGQILIHDNWNRFVLIWDIAVDPPFRRRLIAQAVAWARGREQPGHFSIHEEPHVPKACR
jgi:ribosomal protein S18 acetylase RimI-like enzyme